VSNVMDSKEKKVFIKTKFPQFTKQHNTEICCSRFRKHKRTHRIKAAPDEGESKSSRRAVIQNFKLKYNNKKLATWREEKLGNIDKS
jgi:hypothetical protein